MFPFLGVSIWRELNDRGMNFIPTWETRNSVETSFATWHPDFWSGFARRGTVVRGGECVKKTAENCKFPAKFAGLFSTVCGSSFLAANPSSSFASRFRFEMFTAHGGTEFFH